MAAGRGGVPRLLFKPITLLVACPSSDRSRAWLAVRRLRRYPMMRCLLLTALAAQAQGALELTPDNFDKEVLQSGKAAFIKFLAPW